MSSTGMDVGDLVIWQGRRYRLRGFDPMSVPDRNAYLDDEATGARVAVPVGEVTPLCPHQAAG
jgi:hypothetical protein